PGEEPPAEWGERHDPDAEFTARRYHLVLDVTCPQRPLALQRRHRVYRVGAANSVRACFGNAEIPHLALGDEFGQCAERLLDRHVRIDPMLVVQVDVVDTESPQ